MAERLLNDSVIGQVKQVFQNLKNPVEVIFFEAQEGCDYCADTRQLLEEVTQISDLLTFSAHDIQQDAELTQLLGVDKTPGFVVVGKEGPQRLDYGIRFSGIPAGHEFSSLIHTLLLVSNRDSGLDQKTRNFLAGLKEPVHLQVFVTPT